jgi:hypothetical protein
VYLDPHTIQTAGRLPDVAPTYFCDAVRLMPTAAIDPSLALGFYCRDLGKGSCHHCLQAMPAWVEIEVQLEVMNSISKMGAPQQ